MKVKVIRIPVGEKPYVDEIDNSLESLQSIVGGYIEPLYAFERLDVALIMNEEGKLRQMPVNRVYERRYRGNLIDWDVLVGDMFVIGAHDDEEDFGSLTDYEISQVMELIGDCIITNA